MSEAFETFEDTPPRIAVGLVLIPAIVAVAATVTAPIGLVVAATGVVALVAGARLGSRRILTLGALVQFAGVVVAGVVGASILQVTVGAAATVVAWDAGENAVGVARQVGTRARTRSILLAHTTVTALVALGVAVATLGVFYVTRGGEPTTAIALLVIAAVLFTLLLDR